MTLPEVFKAVMPSIVAFGTRHDITQSPSEPPPPFPTILGTGFVVDPRGIVLTNKHVAESLQKLPPGPVSGKHPAFAMFATEEVLPEARPVLKLNFVDIKGYWMPSKLSVTERYYGEQIPDLAFLQVAVRDVHAVQLAEDLSTLEIGSSIATAGFPLGRDALLQHAKVIQVTPTLRHGIVSSLLPFPCPAPSGFTIDAMVQPGASGSPVFLADTPIIVGMIRAGFSGTNITYALPSSILITALKQMLAGAVINLDSIPTLASLAEKAKPNDGPHWQLRPKAQD